MRDPVQIAARKALLSDPKKGMTFHECLSFWVVITDVEETGEITCLSYGGHPQNPGVTEDGGKFFFSRITAHTLPDTEAFDSKFHYLSYSGIAQGHLRSVTAAYLYQEAILKTLGIKEDTDINAAFKRLGGW